MIDEKEILQVTHHGLNIYSHILRTYYPDRIVLELKGTHCKPALNPFNANKPTLQIRKEEGIFCYKDSELEGFHGSPFDFAYLHFGLTGQPLLERLAQEMYLVVGKPNRPVTYVPDKCPSKLLELSCPYFSYYRAPISNIQPGAEVTLPQIYRAIRGKRYEQVTRELRLITDPAQRRQFKAKKLNYVTFSGTFVKRGDKNLIQHSGLLTLDFDHVTDLAELKVQLLNDSYFETRLMFVSPSGDGLKWIVAIDLTQYTHQDWFYSIAAYVLKKYGLEVDKSGKDVSRACFLCWDPEAFINPKYLE